MYEIALKRGEKVSLSYLKILALGPGQIGKSTFLYRLLGLMEENIVESLKLDPTKLPSRSTGQSDLRDVCIRFINMTGAVGANKCWESCGIQSQVEGLLRLLPEQIQEDLLGSPQNSEINMAAKDLLGPPQNSETNTAAKDFEENVRPSESEHVDSRESPQTDLEPLDPTEVSNKNDKTSRAQSETSMDHTSLRFMSKSTITPQSTPGLVAETLKRYEDLRQKCKHSTDVTKLHMLFNIADVGGQPAFLDMLPALTIGPALYLLFTKLITESGEVLSIDDLTKAHPVKYRIEADKEPQECQKYTYTVEEVLFCALSSIACFGLSDKDVEKYVTKKSEAQKTSSLAVLLGTYADRVDSINDGSKKLCKTESELVLRFKRTEFHRKNLISFPETLNCKHSGGEVFFRVNNKTGSKDEIAYYRDLIETLVEEHFRSYNIPAAWLGLSVCLKIFADEKKTCKVSFADCVKLGEHFQLKKEEVKVALTFLHKYIGLVMYFSNDKYLENLVICNPQVVFSSISELTFNVYDSSSRKSEKVAPSTQQKEFEEKGIFSPRSVKYPQESSEFLSIKDLVHLLVHLNIVAMIPASCDDAHTNEHENHSDKSSNANSTIEAGDLLMNAKYFFPAILKTTDSLEVKEGTEEILPEPLCIRFETGYLPMGFTCALSARLIAKKNFQLSPDEAVPYKNRIKFLFKGEFNITMISIPRWCEFHVTRDCRQVKNIKFHEQFCCPEIRRILCETADEVVKSMQKTYLSASNYVLAFKCPHSTDVHKTNLAKLVYTDKSQTQLKHIKCVEGGTEIPDVKPGMEFWFGEVSAYRIYSICI